MVKFTDEGHLYQSITPDSVKWTSVTTLVHKFVPPFDKTTTALKSSKSPKSKWYNLDVTEIQAAWDGENQRSIELGKWYHGIREQQHLQRTNAVLPDIRDGVKYATNQKLLAGHIYPEHLVYYAPLLITGQSDLVEVTDKNVLNINDYKTCKQIRTSGFKNNYTGVTDKLLSPLNHLDKCEFNEYALQLSLYAFMILRHNPHLIIGKLTIEHVLFEEEGRDKYDYPIYKRNGDDYVVKEVIPIEVPYLLREVKLILDHLKSVN